MMGSWQRLPTSVWFASVRDAAVVAGGDALLCNIPWIACVSLQLLLAKGGPDRLCHTWSVALDLMCQMDMCRLPASPFN
jgi:hypothetical protein